MSRKPYIGRTVYYRRDRKVHKTQKNRSRIPIFIIVLVITVFGATTLWSEYFGKEKVDPTPAVKAAKTYSPSESQIAEMGAKINQTISNYPGMQVSVAIATTKDNKQYQYGVDAPYDAASVGKLLSAITYLQGLEKGTYKTSQQINGQNYSEAMKLMIEQSDNASWEGFNKIIGHPELERYARSIGMTNYSATTNTVSSSDVSKLLSGLYQQKLLNNENTKQLLDYMRNANERDHIVAAIGLSATVYHKAGWLDDRIHDTAIIDDGNYPYVLVIFTKMNYGKFNKSAGQEIYKSITDATKQAFIEKAKITQ